MCFDFLYISFLKHFLFQEYLTEVWTKMHIGLYIYYPLFLSFLMKLEICQQVFKKYSITKFHENPPGESRIVPSGWTDGKTDMPKLNIRFSQFCECT